MSGACRFLESYLTATLALLREWQVTKLLEEAVVVLKETQKLTLMGVFEQMYFSYNLSHCTVLFMFIMT